MAQLKATTVNGELNVTRNLTATSSATLPKNPKFGNDRPLFTSGQGYTNSQPGVFVFDTTNGILYIKSS